MPRWLPWVLVLVLAAGWGVDAWMRREPPTPAPEVTPAAPELAATIRPADEIVALGARRARPWLGILRGTGSAEVKDRVRETVLAAFDSGDPIDLAAALHVARWAPADALGAPAAVRARIEPYLDAEADWLAEAALAAASHVEPQAGDVVRWARLVADGVVDARGEMAAELLVRSAGGRVEGLAADAVLNLLREGAETKHAFVMRGLKDARVLAPAVRERLLDIVAAAAPDDYDSHYFFHFLAPRIAPKSDRLVALALERIGAPGGTDTIELIRSLRSGTSEAQKRRIADALLAGAHEATNPGYFRQLLMGVALFGDASHVESLRALTARDDLDDDMRAQIERALEAVSAR